MDKATPNNPFALYAAQVKDLAIASKEVIAALKILGDRLAVLESVTQEMRSELDEMQTDKDWIGGTD